MLSLVIAEDTNLIRSQLWMDYYQTVCRFFFWYTDQTNKPCHLLLSQSIEEKSLAGAQNKRFELNLGEYDLMKDPIFALKYARPSHRGVEAPLDRISILTIDILISETLTMLRSCKKSEQIIFMMEKMCGISVINQMSALTQNKLVNTVMEFSHAQGPYFAP